MYYCVLVRTFKYCSCTKLPYYWSEQLQHVTRPVIGWSAVLCRHTSISAVSLRGIFFVNCARIVDLDGIFQVISKCCLFQILNTPLKWKIPIINAVFAILKTPKLGNITVQ